MWFKITRIMSSSRKMRLMPGDMGGPRSGELEPVYPDLTGHVPLPLSFSLSVSLSLSLSRPTATPVFRSNSCASAFQRPQHSKRFSGHALKCDNPCCLRVTHPINPPTPIKLTRVTHTLTRTPIIMMTIRTTIVIIRRMIIIISNHYMTMIIILIIVTIIITDTHMVPHSTRSCHVLASPPTTVCERTRRGAPLDRFEVLGR